MNLNPYAAPGSATEDLVNRASRKRWLAVILGLVVPPIAMLYVARPLRAACYLVAMIVSFVVAARLGVKGVLHPIEFFKFAYLVLSLVAAVDGYRLARTWSGSQLPWYSRGPVLVITFAAGWLSTLVPRAFIVEPFRIPSGAMLPTLHVGDLILARKSAYGWNIPFTTRRILTFATPERGDVAVFRYPDDPQIHYVKRVIGLPGDVIAYEGKRLVINAQEQTATQTSSEQGGVVRYRENLHPISHSILVDVARPSYNPASVRDFPGRENCRYRDEGFGCQVPAGNYFVMGDNRDASSDSRYWGFVPESHFVGRAFMVWYSPEDRSRSGTSVQ